jgi:hypothetical protein
VSDRASGKAARTSATLAAASATVELISPEAAYRSYSAGELRQRPAPATPSAAEHVHRGQHAGVGEPEVAEVVVRRVLAAEDRVGPGHLGLDERVADPAAAPGMPPFS